ncbi:MFS transporter [Kineosporia sp. NBRC 101731]|uniref:MFS transporter n=1 Tax=Kineosporia sp. NBRC 101731 TaxID=3032199 RepID=UPI0024A1336F|nr:MFS transporter [Kineosporia sp. NBRC 101731]GLY30031.1 MFS transporter [Kineosporia sp. NBRC 101731]
MPSRFAQASPRHVFRALGVRNFRLFAGGQVLSVTGTWMMIVAQDWLVLGMTDRPGPVLGLVTALQFVPLALFMLYGGRLADRHDKRLLLIGANSVSAVLGLVMAGLVLSGQITIWQICVFAFAVGTVNALEVPTRMSFVSELVGPALLPNASALSSAYFNIARVAGAALAGVLIAGVGEGWVLVLNALSYAFSVAGLARIRVGELHRSSVRPRDGIRAGLRYVAGRRDLLSPIALVAVIGLFALNFQLTLPLLAKTVFSADAGEFGLLSAALAVGSLVSAFVTTARTSRPPARLVCLSAVALGVAELAAGLAPTFGSAMMLLAVVGFTSMYFAQAANHRIQLGSDPQYRGRVLALYSLILQGTTPLGALVIGWVSEGHGARWGLYLGGVAALVAGVVGLVHERTQRYRVDDVPDPGGSSTLDLPEPEENRRELAPPMRRMP